MDACVVVDGEDEEGKVGCKREKKNKTGAESG
jgi:hypothetical protein